MVRSRRPAWLALLFAALSVSLPGPRLRAANVKCPVTRDVWLSAANKKESNTNGGKSPKIKEKVFQEFGLLDFDVSKLKGKQIAKAALRVAIAGGARYGKARGTDLRWFSVSTVSSEWVEGVGRQYTVVPPGKGSTFNEANYQTRPWTIRGSKCWDVILGNGNTLRCDVDAGDPKGGWFTIPLDKRLVEALVAGASHGLMLMDGSTGVDRNCYIASKESGAKAPYLSVTLAGEDTAAPPAPRNLKLQAAPNEASARQGAVEISLSVPPGAFAYRLKLDGKPVPRWQIPFAAKSGSAQRFFLNQLPPGKALTLELAAVDAAGNASAFVSVQGKVSSRTSVPKLPASAWMPKGGEAPTLGGKLKVWAFPEISKLDPLSGKIILERGLEGAASKNSVWDAGSKTVRLAAARGEIVGFQLALETLAGPLTGVKISVGGLGGIKTKLWRTWFVKKGAWQAEYAIPLKPGAGLDIPAADNKIPGQKAGVVAVDLIVPTDLQAGERSGTLTVSGAAGEVQLSLKLKVYSAVIPKEIHFNPELNCYGGPGTAGTKFFFDSFRLAHYHRCTINRVPYHQGGDTNGDWIPKTGPDGHATDWTVVDKNLGPLLDGSAFKDNPRAGVPVPCLYLPLNENWPLPLAPNYHPGAPTSGKHWKARHDIQAKPPEQAFSQAYKDAFVNCTRDWVKHAEEKGWTKTQLQCYFNNKPSYGKDRIRGTAWMMDEPYEYLDWHALNFYARLFHQGTAGAKKAQFLFRGDISRPMWQGSCSDGFFDIMYVGGALFDLQAIVKAQKRRMPVLIHAYGSCNKQTRPNHESTAWCLKSYVTEADGVLPWQSLGGDASFDRGDRSGNSLIVDGRKRFGVNAIASFRVHALRRGAQLVELLRLLQKKKGWGRAHIGALVGQTISLGTRFQQAFTDDAAAVTFKNLNGDAFVKLKDGVLKLLAK